MTDPRRSITLASAPAVLLALGLAPLANAAPLRVPADFPTIQAAVDAAVPGDTVLIAPGTYTQAVAIVAKAITLEAAPDGTDAPVILDGTGLASSIITIDAVADGSVLIRGLTLRNGAGSTIDSTCWPFGPSAYGGAVRVVASRATLDNLRLTNNTATLGGAVWYENGSTLTVNNCTFSANFATEIAAALGGCWFGTPSTLTVTGSTFTANRLEFQFNKFGILTPGVGSADIRSSTFASNVDTLGVVQTPNGRTLRLTVADCTFRENARLFGSVTAFQNGTQSSLLVERTLFESEAPDPLIGGRGCVLVISNNGTPAIVRDCTFINSVTSAVDFVLSTGASLAIDRCTMQDMPDSCLGGAALDGASVTIRDVTGNAGVDGASFIVSGQSSLRLDRARLSGTDRDGLKLQVGDGSSAFVSNLIAINSAGNGIAVSTIEPPDPALPPTDIRLINLTIANNAVGLQIGGVFSGTLLLANTIVSDNIISDFIPSLEPVTTTTTNCIIRRGIYPGTDVRDIDPAFTNLALNDFSLSPGSPAIDAGSNASLLPTSTLDATGLLRRADDPAVADIGQGPAPIVDIGALERASTAPTLACNPADIADSAGTAGPDGQLNNGDFQLFFQQFFAATCTATCGTLPITPCNPADIANTDGSPNPDGCVDNGDFQLFFSSFFAGC